MSTLTDMMSSFFTPSKTAAKPHACPGCGFSVESIEEKIGGKIALGLVSAVGGHKLADSWEGKAGIAALGTWIGHVIDHYRARACPNCGGFMRAIEMVEEFASLPFAATSTSPAMNWL